VTDGAVDRAATRGFDDYDPYELAATVNELRPSGKEGALAAVAEACTRTGGDAVGLFWVLRVLFDVPDDRHPPVRLGEPTIPPPDGAALPRFPIVLVRDVPLLVVRGYTLGGLPEPVEAHLEYYGEHGTVRPEPLAPGDPEAVAAEFPAVWRSAYGDRYAGEAFARVSEQLRR
jgi:hypothetical protein